MKYAVYSGTRNLYEQMVWAAKSLIANSSVDKVFFLIEDDTFPYELPPMVETMNVREYADRVFPDGGVNARTHFTKFALVRICYPELFPEIDKVVQLDIDTVCVDDVDGLWEVDLTDCWFAAVEETLSGYNPYAADQYFNVGVSVFNLEQMRTDKAQDMLVRFINEVKANCVEQDALNFHGSVMHKIRELPTRFNENRACGYTDNPAIVHFVGYMDWQTNPNLPRREYLKLYRNSPWDEIMELHHG